MVQRGFTFIELVIVIVILGLLAVTAVPGLIEKQTGTLASNIQRVGASLDSGIQLVYAKSAIAGIQDLPYAGNKNTQISIQDIVIDTDFGYPDAQRTNMTRLTMWADLNAKQWDVTVDLPAPGSFVITPKEGAYSANATKQCQVVYTEPAAVNERPHIWVQDQGC
ncbi:type II secretion system protein [Alteromonas sp. 14N.309.X.WAT.G.H12]|uniref:type II secretion system protein n=1 Tax=Alteromonas sp. 14N.309.X.WAT.G.H12 TaxID=3120824 RepID=UPI002FD4882A